MSSVRGPQVSHREFNLAIGKLPPVLDDRREVSLRELIEDFAGFATSFLNWQLEYLRRLRGGHPLPNPAGERACQTSRTPEAGWSKSCRFWAKERETKGLGRVR